ncbi:PREDICTED: uncharacterized protein LOC106751137 [Dinoponera quadriceps]|uniref:Uncharacterized protein LOC106751137 n=1 Tax=Dinoponera quadriceps TaxID=609295 RepID=A0A6P3Y934_DINQU|nr:PREDICTED: uncharacterized protein LOC106751137 [Dinoponera quadriceps]XP_014487431.1 PREDICTED: uncharacterized protein LOC106751137 [Dinoponera quadriceps]
MKRSPLSTPSGPSRRRHTPYNWNSNDNANKRGYEPMRNGGYQCLPANDGMQQICGDDFIPLNMSTPMTQYKKNNGKWHSPRGGRNNSSPDSRGSNYRNSYGPPRSNNPSNPNARCNYRNNYYTPSRSSNSLFSPYKQPFKKFYNQKKGDKAAHRRVSISEFVDIPFCLKDPWEDLMKKLNDSEDTDNDQMLQTESSANLELVDNDSTEKSESKGFHLPRDVNLNDSQDSEESKMNSSVDTTFGEDTINVSKTSKADSSVDLEIGDICFNQDSMEENTSSNSDSAPRATAEKDDAGPVVELVADTDEKNI